MQGDEPFWSAERARHLLVMAYMDGWSDRDMGITYRDSLLEEARRKAAIATLDGSADVYT